MKKRIKLYLIGLISFCLFIDGVSASSVVVKPSAYTITKGNTVTINVTVSSSSPLVSIEGSLSCSGAGVTGGLDLRFDDSSNSVYNKSYSLSVKSTTSGTITCGTSNVRITNMSSDNWEYLTNSSTSVKVNEPVVIPPKTYSSNNNLKKLEVEGTKIDFNKDTLEYSIEVENNVKSVKINAISEDEKAKVTGNGDREVVEGNNKLEVVVTAENGNTKTYIINVLVKELNPIEITIDKNKYTIIRKEGVIDPPSEFYEQKNIKINNEEVLAYYNPKTKITLVGLKDSDGKSNYYIYKDGNYTLYNEYNFGNLVLYILDMDKKILPSDCHKTNLTYNDQKIEAYKYKNSHYYFIYAMNVETGKESLYVYEESEKSIIKYSDEIFTIEKEKDYKIYYIIGGIIVSIIVIVVSICLIIKSGKSNMKRK